MEELSLHVDREVEKVYIKLLRKELQHPEKWGVFNSWNNQYYSPEINDNCVYFVTVGKSSSSIYVYQKSSNGSNSKIHEIKIPFWDFKTPNLMGKLFSFMPHKKEWEKAQNTTKTLKELLGIEFDRYAKIMKIKKKL
jgi:hypothetical protein